MEVEHSVLDRYSEGADQVQPDLSFPEDNEAT